MLFHLETTAKSSRQTKRVESDSITDEWSTDLYTDLSDTDTELLATARAGSGVSITLPLPLTGSSLHHLHTTTTIRP